MKTNMLKILSNQNTLLYRPELNEITGSVNATLLLQQIIYWWQKNGGKEFYKFKEPCNHRLYQKGDSWCEELGFTKRNFDTAIKTIGFKRGSGIDGQIPENEALFTYFTDKTRLTKYVLNEDLLSKSLNALYSYNTENTTENTLCPVSQDEEEIPLNPSPSSVSVFEQPSLIADTPLTGVENSEGVESSTIQTAKITSSSDEKEPVLQPKEAYEIFIDRFNVIFKRKHRVTANMTAKLKTRMKTFSLDEVMEALERLGEWPFAHGDNDTGWQASPDYFLRNDAQIDRFLNKPPSKPKSEAPIVGFERPDKRLSVEIRLMAGLETGGWGDSISWIYGQELMPWMKKKDVKTDFEKTTKLLVQFIEGSDPRLETSDITWSSVVQTYKRYLQSCEIKEVEPRLEIVERGEEVMNERQLN